MINAYLRPKWIDIRRVDRAISDLGVLTKKRYDAVEWWCRVYYEHRGAACLYIDVGPGWRCQLLWHPREVRLEHVSFDGVNERCAVTEGRVVEIRDRLILMVAILFAIGARRPLRWGRHGPGRRGSLHVGPESAGLFQPRSPTGVGEIPTAPTAMDN